jgi:hypothetical protein
VQQNFLAEIFLVGGDIYNEEQVLLMYPFKQVKIGNLLLREFKESTDSADFVWHRDRWDRIIKVVKGSGWQLQLENSLPIPLDEGTIAHIPAGEYHRVIRGTTDLYVLIHESNDKNSDGDVNFDDVKISRMRASGMSDEEIREKHPELFETDKKKINPAYLKGSDTTDALMRDEIEKCTKKPTPKSCYDYWDADKQHDKERANEVVIKDLRLVKEYVKNFINEKKSESSSNKLSKETKEKLNKIADKKGYTRGSVYTEYRKGLAAWLTGHRPGVSQHQWAMARVNKATPSKSWASVKKKND